MPLDFSKVIILGNAEKYQSALLQLNSDFELLKNNLTKVHPLLKEFNKAFLTNPACIETKEAEEFASVKITQTRNSITKSPSNIEEKVENPFAQPIGDQINADLLKLTSSTENNNFKKLYGLVNNVTHACGDVCQLAYHILPHTGAEMISDPSALISMAKLTDWQLFVSICGLFHDSIFLRSRVDDENDSAKLLLLSLTPFLTKLDNENKALFEALVRVTLVAGTLPVFTAPEKTTADNKKEIDFSKMQMYGLWEFYLDNFKETGHDRAELSEIFTVCQAMSDADVQRTLIPELLKGFPVVKAKEPATPLSLLDELYNQPATEFSSANNLPLENAREIITNKLGQSTRFLTETKDPKAPFAPLNATQIKLATVLRGGKAKFNLDDEKAEDFKNLISLIDGEIKWSDFNLRSLKPVTYVQRAYSFHISSWSAHKKTLMNIKEYITSPDKTPAQKNDLMQQLLINARNQQGLRLNVPALLDRMMRDARASASLTPTKSSLKNLFICNTTTKSNKVAPAVDSTHHHTPAKSPKHGGGND